MTSYCERRTSCFFFVARHSRDVNLFPNDACCLTWPPFLSLHVDMHALSKLIMNACVMSFFLSSFFLFFFFISLPPPPLPPFVLFFFFFRFRCDKWEDVITCVIFLSTEQISCLCHGQSREICSENIVMTVCFSPVCLSVCLPDWLSVCLFVCLINLSLSYCLKSMAYEDVYCACTCSLHVSPALLSSSSFFPFLIKVFLLKWY